jgi:hypothetical protein
MQVKILKEEGHDLALRGMAYSFKDRASDPDEWWAGQSDRAIKRAPLLAVKDGGHNKFIESIVVWIDIEASRAFWSEFDTYRVGTTKQSESTMHTLSKRGPVPEDFEEGTHWKVIDAFIDVWLSSKGDINVLKMNLPEGFLQRRLVCTNYKVLRNIISQREGHRLKSWGMFIEKIIEQVEHPEYLK